MTETQPKESSHAPGAKDPNRGNGGAAQDGPLDYHDTLRIAVAAECSPATVVRFWSGQPVRQLSERRILRALTELGIAAPGRAA